MPYNLSIVANSSGITELTQNVNTYIMEGWWGTMILLMIFGIMLLSLLARTNNPRVSFAATTFVCFTLSMFLLALGLIQDLVFFILLIMAAFSVAILKLQ